MKNININITLIEKHILYIEPTDKLPKDKKPIFSLQELEKQVNVDLNLFVNIVDGQMTDGELVYRYLKKR